MSTHLLYVYLENYITSLDFNPNGEIAATLDRSGVCVISDVNTDSYRFHVNMSSGQEYFEFDNFQLPSLF